MNGLDGESHPLFILGEDEHGHGEEEGAEPFGERELENFAFTARVTALIDVGLESTLQVGASVAWSPEDREFVAGELMMGDDEAPVFSADRERLIMGIDLRYAWHDVDTGRGFVLATEILFSHQDNVLETTEADSRVPNSSSPGVSTPLVSMTSTRTGRSVFPADCTSWRRTTTSRSGISVVLLPGTSTSITAFVSKPVTSTRTKGKTSSASCCSGPFRSVLTARVILALVVPELTRSHSDRLGRTTTSAFSKTASG